MNTFKGQKDTCFQLTNFTKSLQLVTPLDLEMLSHLKIETQERRVFK